MNTVTIPAYAKLNLTLDILGIRSDGYHELDMVMQAVSLHDDVTLTTGTRAPWMLTCEDSKGTPLAGIPCDEKNLAWKAAQIFFRAANLPDPGVKLHIVKRIPEQAGLAGGSADAAAVLRGLNRLYGEPFGTEALCNLGAKCGSDVPFCILGGTARVKGRGEVLSPTPLDTVQHYVICKPDFGISTPKLFALSDQYPAQAHPDPEKLLTHLRADDKQSAGPLLCNVLEPVAAMEHPQILSIREELLAAGACGARMTGSGSAVFGLFPDESGAKQAEIRLKCNEYSVFYACSV
ncbi:MAG: 4-(cytidine 5'-diphospho)-2-C-methyl-D-erythritol kinase [Ruminococcaceae bacterium]|nr:4-(cytidine 5'-diphospho)-2-C-methyl-D-erythritol kinase [Oscillospiraceae bacterium]